MSPLAHSGRSRSRTQSAPLRSRMSSLFNTIRASIYGTVLFFTVICLAMAGHFQSILAASDLTRFVPFAIFVCSASLFIFSVLLAFSFFLRGRNPISTRIELASLGLTGIFWLVLGVYLTTSVSQSADVECFSADGQTLLDSEVAAFHTDQYQAMYRVLNAFSLMNAALVLFACLALLFLAIRRHRNGDEHMWHGPVTSCAWFNDYGKAKLGAKGKNSGSNVLPITGKPIFTEKPERKASARRGQYTKPHPSQPYPSRNPYPTPPKPYPTRQGGSPRSGPGIADLENGKMLSPYTSNSGHGGSR